MNVPVVKNEIYNMKIDRLGNDGEGIGNISGFTVFVDKALPGDEISVKILKVKKSFAYGKIENFIVKSDLRVPPPCKYFGKCGGCQLQHIKYSNQLEYKTKKVSDCLKRIGEIEDISVLPIVGAKNLFHYRNKGQFPVGVGKDGNINIGFFSQRSHNIIDIDSCLIQHEITDSITNIVKNFIIKNNISVYDEATGKGLVRHILTRIGFSTGEIMICIVINGNSLPKSELLVEDLKEIDGVASIVVNINKKNTNVILGDKISVLWGKEYITDYIGDLKFEISPLSFYQVNPEQTKVLYENALESAGLSGNESVLDIYCGIGTISLFFAQKAKNVIGVEVIEEAIEDAKRNATLNNLTNVEFVAGDAADVIPNLNNQGFKADVVVVDPPRKGLDERVLNAIVGINPKKIVYISCDPATMARDVKFLVENSYEVNKVLPVDQFVMSTHVEAIIMMTYCGDKAKNEV